MFKVVQKLKNVKGVLKDINKYGYSDIQAEAAKAQQHLMQTQTLLHANPMDVDLMEQERAAQKMYKERNEAYMQFLKQKVKIQWIREGDENTTLFHNSIKKRRIQNNIYAIKDKHGNIQDSPNGIQEAFLDYYKDLLGSKLEERIEVQADIVSSGPVLTELQQNALLQPVSDKEIKQALFAIQGDKAPGPDGFGAHFYKHNWDIVGSDVIKAIRDYFENR
ncbi:LINE-1 retrotransposable element ORF2 protein [Bienertia sinuspersici]